MPQQTENQVIKLFDWGHSLNRSKNNLLEGNPLALKQYDPWTIRRLVAQSQDTLIEANQMNVLGHLAADLQYMYFLHAIPKKSRFSKWPKKKIVSDSILMIAEYYQVNIEIANTYFNRMNDEQFNELRDRIEKGGRGKLQKGKRK